MALAKSSTNQHLLTSLLTPSSLSGTAAILVALAATAGTILFTHANTTIREGVLGLHLAYTQSSLSQSAQLSSSSTVNTVLLATLWGSVGLLVYSIVRGLTSELRHTTDLVHSLTYVHMRRREFLAQTAVRAFVRIGALACWWLLLWFTAYRVIPYTVAAAHFSAIHTSDAKSWLRMLLAGIGCTLCIHSLTILMRLVFLRVRAFGDTLPL